MIPLYHFLLTFVSLLLLPSCSALVYKCISSVVVQFGVHSLKLLFVFLVVKLLGVGLGFYFLFSSLDFC